MTIIRQTRQNLGLRTTDLAKLANIYPSTLSQIETGNKAGPSLRSRISNALGAEPSELFDDNGWPIAT